MWEDSCLCHHVCSGSKLSYYWLLSCCHTRINPSAKHVSLTFKMRPGSDLFHLRHYHRLSSTSPYSLWCGLLHHILMGLLALPLPSLGSSQHSSWSHSVTPNIRHVPPSQEFSSSLPFHSEWKPKTSQWLIRSPFSSSLIAVQAPWLAWYSWNASSMLSTHSLCSCYSLCLECAPPPPQIPAELPLSLPSGPCSDVTLLGGSFPISRHWVACTAWTPPCRSLFALPFSLFPYSPYIRAYLHVCVWICVFKYIYLLLVFAIFYWFSSLPTRI